MTTPLTRYDFHAPFWSSPQLLEILQLFHPLNGRGEQLSGEQIIRVASAILSRTNCRLLIFGIGDDAPFWCACNRFGRTLFIEDQATWVKRLQRQIPTAEICSVSYTTRLNYWQMSVSPPAGWPETIHQQPWDVILVDAPGGFREGTPGRQQSIWMASQLMNLGTTVSVAVLTESWHNGVNKAGVQLQPTQVIH